MTIIGLSEPPQKPIAVANPAKPPAGKPSAAASKAQNNNQQAEARNAVLNAQGAEIRPPAGVLLMTPGQVATRMNGPLSPSARAELAPYANASPAKAPRPAARPCAPTKKKIQQTTAHQSGGYTRQQLRTQAAGQSAAYAQAADKAEQDAARAKALAGYAGYPAQAARKEAAASAQTQAQVKQKLDATLATLGRDQGFDTQIANQLVQETRAALQAQRTRGLEQMVRTTLGQTENSTNPLLSSGRGPDPEFVAADNAHKQAVEQGRLAGKLTTDQMFEDPDTQNRLLTTALENEGKAEGLKAQPGDRWMSGLEAAGGTLEAVAGGAIAVGAGWTGVGAVVGAALMADGGQRAVHGVKDTINDETTQGFITAGLAHAGMDPTTASRIDTGVGVAGMVTGGGAGLVKGASMAAAKGGLATTSGRLATAGVAGNIAMMADWTLPGAVYAATGNEPWTPLTVQGGTAAFKAAGMSPENAQIAANYALMAGGPGWAAGRGIVRGRSSGKDTPEILEGTVVTPPQRSATPSSPAIGRPGDNAFPYVQGPDGVYRPQPGTANPSPQPEKPVPVSGTEMPRPAGGGGANLPVTRAPGGQPGQAPAVRQPSVPARAGAAAAQAGEGSAAAAPRAQGPAAIRPRTAGDFSLDVRTTQTPHPARRTAEAEGPPSGPARQEPPPSSNQPDQARAAVPAQAEDAAADGNADPNTPVSTAGRDEVLALAGDVTWQPIASLSRADRSFIDPLTWRIQNYQGRWVAGKVNRRYEAANMGLSRRRLGGSVAAGVVLTAAGTELAAQGLLGHLPGKGPLMAITAGVVARNAVKAMRFRQADLWDQRNAKINGLLQDKATFESSLNLLDRLAQESSSAQQRAAFNRTVERLRGHAPGVYATRGLYRAILKRRIINLEKAAADLFPQSGDRKAQVGQNIGNLRATAGSKARFDFVQQQYSRLARRLGRRSMTRLVSGINLSRRVHIEQQVRLIEKHLADLGDALPGNDRKAVEGLKKSVDSLEAVGADFRSRSSFASWAIDLGQFATYAIGLSYIRNYGLGQAPTEIMLTGLFGAANAVDALRISGTRMGDIAHPGPSVAGHPFYKKALPILYETLKIAAVASAAAKAGVQTYTAKPHAGYKEWMEDVAWLSFLAGFGRQYYVNARNRWAGADPNAEHGVRSRKAFLRSQQAAGVGELALMAYLTWDRFLNNP